MQSIAIVPIGITKYRDNLEKVDIFDKKSSIELIKQIEKFQKNYLQKLKTRFVFLSDEFYVMSGIKRPTHKEYEGYKQLENGVGLMTKQEFEYNKELKKIKTYDKKRTISIATGTSAYDFIKELSNNIANQFQTLTISVYKIRNDFFGETITVAGLVTATDMLNQLAGKNLGDELLIPKVMLKSDEDIFLDSITLKDFEQKLGTKVRVVDVDGYSFVKNVLDI